MHKLSSVALLLLVCASALYAQTNVSLLPYVGKGGDEVVLVFNSKTGKSVEWYFDEAEKKMAKAQGYVETVFGRRLVLPSIQAAKGALLSSLERQAVNAPMQGTAADLIKLSMVAVQKALDEQQRGTKMIMQVHDELVFEVPEGEVDWLKTEIPRLMAGVAALKVPLLAEVGVGANWDQAH